MSSTGPQLSAHPEITLNLILLPLLPKFPKLTSVCEHTWFIWYWTCMCVCLHVCMYTMSSPDAQGSQKGIRSPRTVVTGGCELLCGCWAPNPGLLQDSKCSYLMSHLSCPKFIYCCIYNAFLSSWSPYGGQKTTVGVSSLTGRSISKLPCKHFTHQGTSLTCT